MSVPTTVTYSFAGGPVTLAIPAGIDYTQFVLNMVRAGGFWYTSAAGVQTWVPLSAITGATAQ